MGDNEHDNAHHAHGEHHEHHEEPARSATNSLGSRGSKQGSSDETVSFREVAGARPGGDGKRCIDKVEMVEETEYEQIAFNETVEICRTPLVKDCNIQGPEICRTE